MFITHAYYVIREITLLHFKGKSLKITDRGVIPDEIDTAAAQNPDHGSDPAG
jgi:hypothetical protein